MNSNIKYTILAIFAMLFTNSYAQELLMFPENFVGARNDLPLDVCLRESSELLSKIDNKDVNQLPKLRMYGYQLLNFGKHEYGREVFEKALEITNQAYGKQDLRYVQALIDVAQSYIFLVRYVESAGMYEEALSTIKNVVGENSIEYIAAVNEVAMVYSRVYDWGKTLSYSKRGLEYLKKIKKDKGIYQAIMLNNVGAAYKNMYDFANAITNYKAALTLAKGNPRIELSLAANLAEAMAYAGQAQEAKDLVDKYKKEASKLLTSKDLSSFRPWVQFGIAYTALKDFEAAKTCFKNAFIANSLVFTTVDNIADQANDLMFKNSYIATCGQAGIMIYTIEMYKQLYEQTGDIQALKDGHKVLLALSKFGDNLIDSYLSEANKLLLFRLGSTIIYDRSIYFSYELYLHTKDPKYLENALSYSERSKSTLLVNALRSKENRSLVNLPDEMYQKEKTYIATLRNFQKKQLEATSQEEKAKIQQNINDLNLQLEHFKEELREKYPNYYQHQYNFTLCNLKAIQSFLAQKDEVMIEYALGLEKHYAFVVTKNSLEMVPLQFNPMEMQLHTGNMRTALTDYHFILKNPEKADSLFTESSLFFYTTFVKPLLKNVKKGQHLLIVPDQNLGHLPFETFLMSKPTKALDFADYPYLLKDYPISYSYSATILLGQKRREKDKVIPKDGVLAFAAEYPETEKGTSYSHQRGGGLGVTREGLQPLPGAKKEVEMMDKYFLGEFYHGGTASEETFKKTAKNYGIIHLAMHGVLDNKNPILSSLVFSEDSSDTEDNFLRAYEIAQLDLNADLVVLSACETGFGQFQQGEGIMSLAHSFSYAGASAVLMSLWQVNDFSTGQIMKNFYTNIEKGMSKDQALREAKLTYLADPANKAALHPAFWAAFVQTGDVAALELYSKTGNIFTGTGVMMGVLAVLLLVVGYVMVRRTSQQKIG